MRWMLLTLVASCVLRDVRTEVVYRERGTGVITMHFPEGHPLELPTVGESMVFHEDARELATPEVLARSELVLEWCEIATNVTIGRRVVRGLDYVTCRDPDADTLRIPWRDVEIVEHARARRSAAEAAVLLSLLSIVVDVAAPDRRVGDIAVAAGAAWDLVWLPTLFGSDRDTIIRTP